MTEAQRNSGVSGKRENGMQICIWLIRVVSPKPFGPFAGDRRLLFLKNKPKMILKQEQRFCLRQDVFCFFHILLD